MIKNIKSLINKNRTISWVITFGLILIGILMVHFSLIRNFNLIVNGEPIQVRTKAITPLGVIRDAGYTAQNDDLIIPQKNKILFKSQTIKLMQAQSVSIFDGLKTYELISYEKIPANLLHALNIKLFSGDQIFWNGYIINPNQPIENDIIGVIQLRRALEINLDLDGNNQLIYSAKSTIGEALAEANIFLKPGDRISKDPSTPLDRNFQVSIRSARPVKLSIQGEILSGYSSANTTGEALADLGIFLHDLDYSIPDDQTPLPSDGNIRVVRVRESLVITKEEFPFSISYQPDPETELDQSSVIQPGQVGLIINRTRIRYENDQEKNKLSYEPWQASLPQDGILGYGTKVVVRKESVGSETIEYFRKISVYATSYAPRTQGGIYTGTTATASGLTLEKGIIAVLPSWYRAMKFQRVFIPGYGYGIIADTGGGIPGTPWIDLGFSDNDYESWHSWVTMYFLTPVPSYIPYLLP